MRRLHRLYANAVPFYVKDLSFYIFWCPKVWVPGTNPPRTLRHICVYPLVPKSISSCTWKLRFLAEQGIGVLEKLCEWTNVSPEHKCSIPLQTNGVCGLLRSGFHYIKSGTDWLPCGSALKMPLRTDCPGILAGTIKWGLASWGSKQPATQEHLLLGLRAHDSKTHC